VFSDSNLYISAPAQAVIEYETRVFHEGFGKDRTIYQMPPSPEVDAAWEDLYNCSCSLVVHCYFATDQGLTY